MTLAEREHEEPYEIDLGDPVWTEDEHADCEDHPCQSCTSDAIDRIMDTEKERPDYVSGKESE